MPPDPDPMSTRESFFLGIRSSGDYFLSTFLFGIMFGVTATAVGLEHWQALLMSAATFTASGQFAALEFWESPLPYGTIALSVALVSTRNVLMGMAMTHHFDGHGLGRRMLWLFLLNDPGVVRSYQLGTEVDRLGYITGYGLSMMTSWLVSTWLGLQLANLFTGFDLAAVSFAGPLVMASMMVLFVRGSKSSPAPWAVSGLVALLLVEAGAESYLVLLLSVVAGATTAAFMARRADA